MAVGNTPTRRMRILICGSYRGSGARTASRSSIAGEKMHTVVMRVSSSTSTSRGQATRETPASVRRRISSILRGASFLRQWSGTRHFPGEVISVLRYFSVITIPLEPGADFRSTLPIFMHSLLAFNCCNAHTDLPDHLSEWQFSNPLSAVGRKRYRGGKHFLLV